MKRQQRKTLARKHFTFAQVRRLPGLTNLSGDIELREMLEDSQENGGFIPWNHRPDDEDLFAMEASSDLRRLTEKLVYPSTPLTHTQTRTAQFVYPSAPAKQHSICYRKQREAFTLRNKQIPKLQRTFGY
ncbi:hypothetical protein F2P79_003902 [Pimephales promelas]|nr:hypothetical protein F2P79_003902 [Pimephales promelas]